MARGTRSRSTKDTADATTVVSDRGAAVEQAAAAGVVDDAPDAVSEPTQVVSEPTEAGDGDRDPLSSFLDAAESKSGRDTSLTAPSDSQEANAADGKPSVADDDGDDSGLDSGDDPDDDGGGTIDFTPDLGDFDQDLDKGDDPDDDSDDTVEDPGSDGEGGLIPAELQAQLDSDVGRFRAGRPDTGDEVADPSEVESEAVGPAGALTSQAERGQSFFGQPSFEAPSGSDANFNPGADSAGGGTIDPGEDQSVPTGATRNDDPFADAGPAAEPVTSSNDATDSQSFLPSETTGTAIDDKPDIPDPVSDPV